MTAAQAQINPAGARVNAEFRNALHDAAKEAYVAVAKIHAGMAQLLQSKLTVTAIYDRNAYLPEKRKALDKWAALLAKIVGAR